jgi:hypothetical protein
VPNFYVYIEEPPFGIVIVIESINLNSDEQVEIHIATSGTIDTETFGA